MNAQLKQQIDERLARLSDSRMAEVLDFVEFLNAKEQAGDAERAGVLGGSDAVQNRLRQIVTLPPQGRLTALQLDLAGYKFDRQEANAR
jgi:erythromycin esterase-like protein